MNKKTMNSWIRKTGVVVFSLIPMAIGVSFYIYADIGTDPYSVLIDGASKQLHLEFGTASFLVSGLLTALFAIFYRKHIMLGTLICALGTGPVINVILPIIREYVPLVDNIFYRLIICLTGVLFISVAVAIYLPCEFGASPVDITVLAMCALIKKSYKWGFYMAYSAFLVLGLVLGGKVGIGTIFGSFLTGPIIEVLMKLFKKPINKLIGEK